MLPLSPRTAGSTMHGSGSRDHPAVMLHKGTCVLVLVQLTPVGEPTCVVCLERRPTMAVYPCGYRCLCAVDAPRFVGTAARSAVGRQRASSPSTTADPSSVGRGLAAEDSEFDLAFSAIQVKQIRCSVRY
jgi:hypothetical protein